MDARLKVQTLAPRRELPSGWFELALIAAYGAEGWPPQRRARRRHVSARAQPQAPAHLVSQG